MVQEDGHLLTVMRYDEANPLRAGMVADLVDWRWSSYAHHAGLAADDLVSEAPVWAGLGRDEAGRSAFWRGWVHEPLPEDELGAVRKSVTSGRPYGSEAWAKATAARLGISLATRPRGRPKKSAEK